MEPAEQLSLSWDAHQKSICSGLSLLQQRGEFVDMTLAADGHHVKVHQMVLSLVSPYIKELISSAQCPHPVIFLNNISYTTLCALLEYIYTGEVSVAKNKLSHLIAAGKALHIRGLREMDGEQSTDITAVSDSDPCKKKHITERLKELKEKRTEHIKDKTIAPKPICKIYLDDTNGMHEDSTTDIQDEDMDTSTKSCNYDSKGTLNESNNDEVNLNNPDDCRKILLNPKLQFTVSNQGGLQVIFNRYMYYLRYFSKRGRKKLWRCVDYCTKLKCAASICTNANNQVVERSLTHNHPLHDNRILKKFNSGVIYSDFQDALHKADNIKKKSA